MKITIRCKCCGGEATADSSVRWDIAYIEGCPNGPTFVDAGSPPIVRYGGKLENIQLKTENGVWMDLVPIEDAEVVEEVEQGMEIASKISERMFDRLIAIGKELADTGTLNGVWRDAQPTFYALYLEQKVKDYEQVLEFYADIDNWPDDVTHGTAQQVLEKYRKK